MAKVEGMPLGALENGVPWSWETFGEYLDRLEGGDRGERRLPRRSLRAAQVRDGRGRRRARRRPTSRSPRWSPSSTARSRPAGSASRPRSRTRTPTATGKPVPSRWATHEEVLALCGAVKDHEGTTLEGIVDGCLDQFSDDEIDLLVQMSVAGDRPLNWNVLTVDSRVPQRVPRQLEASTQAAAAGGRRRRAHDAGHRPDEHELPQLLRALHAPGLEGRHDAAGPRAHREAAGPGDPRAGWTSGRTATRPACSVASPTGGTTCSATPTPPPTRASRAGRVREIVAERGTAPFDTLLDIVIERRPAHDPLADRARR